MKKVLFFVLFVSSLFAIPPCEMPNESVCMYFYRSPMGAELIITNLSMDKVVVKYASGSLDGQRKSITDLVLERGQNFTFLKSTYKTAENKPDYGIWSFSYKVVK